MLPPGDMVAQHNHLRDIFAAFCQHAHLSVKGEVGYGLCTGHFNSLLQMSLFRAGTEENQLAAFAVTVTSVLFSDA